MPNWLKRWLVRLTLLTLAYYLWFPLFIYRLSESQDNRITVIDAYRMDNTKIPINRPYDPQMFSLTLANGTTISLKDSFLLKHSMNTKLIKNHFYYYTDLPIENDYPEETKVFYPDGCEVGSECGIVKPTFMILGGQKCGTTSLFHYLLKHPQLLPLGNQSKALGGKETRFFDRPDAAYEKMDKLKYLKDNFMQLKDLRDLNKHSKRLVTGESTPNYLRSPVAPARIKEMFPDMKFIVLLRQPVDRSYSQFNHALRIDGQEQRYTGGNVFETFVRAENMMIYHCNNNHTTAAEYHKCMQTESARAVDALQIPASGPQKNRLVWALQNLERGLYARQLHAFAEAFPDPRQFFIAQSEEFYSQPVKVMEKLQQFLGLEDFDWQQATKGIYNFGQGNGVVRGERGSDYKPLDDRLREEIKRLFQPFNKELFAMFQNNRFPSSLWD